MIGFVGVQLALSRDVRLTAADLADLTPTQIRDLFGALNTIATLTEVAKQRVAAGPASPAAARPQVPWRGYACTVCFHSAHHLSRCAAPGCPCHR